MRTVLAFIWEIAKLVIIALLIVIPIRYFLFEPFLVRGQSMEPNLGDGDYLIVEKISYQFREPQRGEVVVLKLPHHPSLRYIKRIIGLPGETVEIREGKVMITNERGTLILDESDYLGPEVFTPGEIGIFLGENEYFVLGDNRYTSVDSRRWGPVARENIIGRVAIRAWPLGTFTKFVTPAYQFDYYE